MTVINIAYGKLDTNPFEFKNKYISCQLVPTYLCVPVLYYVPVIMAVWNNTEKMTRSKRIYIQKSVPTPIFDYKIP